MKFIEVVGSYNNFTNLKNFVLELIDEYNTDFQKYNQLALQYYQTPTWDCCMGKDKTRDETKFINVMPQLQGTLLDDFFKNVPYKLCRSRIFLARARTQAYTVHHDKYKRLHLPIVTNKDAYFKSYEDGEKIEKHMPADSSLYLVNTLVDHTFVNDGNEDRIHIVGSVFR